MAFLQEPERQPFLRVPAVTAGLILVLIVAHVARTMVPPALSNTIIVEYALFPARYSHAYLTAHGLDPGSLWDRAIPFFSYTFLHGNYTHLFVNCVWLLPFGTITARRFGAATFLLFFFVCGALAAATHLFANWGSTDYVIGASGAIAGTMGAGFRIIAPINAQDLQTFAASVSGQARFQRPLAPIYSPRILVWTAVWLIINLVAGTSGLGGAPGTGPQLIAWQAHMGGYIAGLLLAGPFDALGRALRPAIPEPSA
jgi:membrane associated rhomboid family serine protease